MSRSGKAAGAGEDFGAQLARWVRANLRDKRGEPRMTEDQLIHDAGIGRAGLYDILAGRAGASRQIKQETIDKIAAALGVKPPTILPSLVMADDAIPPPTTPLGLINEAAALLQQARDLVAESTLSEAEAVRARLALSRTGVRPKRPKDTREKPA